MLNLAISFIEFFIKWNIVEIKNFGIIVRYFATSIAKLDKFENGLSATTAIISFYFRNFKN